MEKEEAFSLRDAMEQMDMRNGHGRESPDEDSRLYQAALDEAAELVWQHENGGELPRPDGPYRYRPHLRKDSYAHARTASIGSYGSHITATGIRRDAGYRSVSNSSAESDSYNSCRQRQSSETMESVSRKDSHGSRRKTYGGIGFGMRMGGSRRKSSQQRNISGEVGRPFSEDQIWEEPEANTPKGKPTSVSSRRQTLEDKSQNTARPHFPGVKGDVGAVKARDSVEIHRNPPSRSNNAYYTTNGHSPASVPATDDQVERKNGVEIRSKDIREATSMRLKDRSAKLPEPTAVSDSPGRPIVSFNTNWKPPGESTDDSSGRPQEAAAFRGARGGDRKPLEIPSIVVADEEPVQAQPQPPSIPTICVGDDGDAPSGPVPAINVPTICVDETPSVPSIVAPDDDSSGNSRPLPAPKRKAAGLIKAQNRRHWSPAPGTSSRGRTLCHECGFPIEGRFIALAGITERFHTQCFSCYACGTGLEAMEISPEPDSARNARLDRIRRRTEGEVLDEVPGLTEEEDGDDRLRFYCHLDWHELFAPRCKHCKTPILGEHIVALGDHWHYGHFFCAECGDPFEHGMTHIEKDGYAWCINCQTKRTERRAPKCKRCKKAVIGQYVQALGGEWHDECFRCADCQGGFDDGQIFPKETESGSMVVTCTQCRMAELKR